MKLAVIGCGNMATALVGGMLESGVLEASSVIASDALPAQAERFGAMYGCATAADNAACVEAADYILLAVKPQMLPEIAADLRGELPEGSVVISILAGKSLQDLETAFGASQKIIRVMPNTPALVKAGMSALSKNEAASPEEAAFVKTLLSACGEVIEIPERLMDTFSSVASCSPAYVYMMISAMIDAAVADGMAFDAAKKAAAQAVLGSAQMVLSSKEHPEELKARVCSPGGTTIEGVAVLEEAGFRSAIIEALRAATEKAKRL